MKVIAGLMVFAFFLVLAGCNDSQFLKTIPVQEIDLTQVPDGVYSGSYKLKLPAGSFVGNSSASVNVTVSGHKYQAVELTGGQNFIAKTMKPYLDKMVALQKIHVPDSVSGASYTKKAIQKAVENAFISNN